MKKQATLTTKSTAVGQFKFLKLLAGLAAVLTFVASSIATSAAVVAHWKFDESGGSTAHDSAGSYNGMLSPIGAAFVSGGVSSNALSLDRAANGFVNMGDVLGLTTGDFSIVAWVKMNAGDTTPDTVVIGKHEAFYDNGYFLAINGTGGGGQVEKVLFYEGHIAGAPVSTNGVTDGNWHQIVCVYKAGGNKSIYVDGSPAEDIKSSEAFLANPASLLIGGTFASGNPRGLYTGLIDEVQIYDHALSDADVDFIFQHPGQIVLDCSQQLAAVQAQLAAANATVVTLQTELAAVNQNVQSLQNEILALAMPLQSLTQDFRTKFKDAQFEMPGETIVEQMQNLVGAILDLNRGQKQKIFIDLGGQKNRK